MTTINYILIAYFTFTPVVSSNFLLTDTEFDITLAVVQKLEIRQCILIGGHVNNPKIISDVKKFSAEKLPSVYLNYHEAIIYINASNANERNYYHTAIILNKEALSDLREIADYIKTTYVQSFPFRFYTWFIFARVELIMEQHLVIPYNCEFIVIESENGTSYKLTELYEVKDNSFVLDLGTWNQDTGLGISETNFYWRRLNLNASILTLVSLNGYVCPMSYEDCLVLEIINLLSDKMNFGLRTRFDINATEMLENGNGDFLNLIQPYNQPWVEIIGPIINIKMRWLIKDQRSGLRPDYYTQPFETNMWLALLSSAVFLTISSLIINQYTDKSKRNWIDDIFLGLESLCNQCGNDSVQNDFLRFSLISLQITVIVTAAAYGAFITSFLAVRKFEIPFKNADEFLSNGQYKLGTESSSSQEILLREFGNGFYHNEVMKKIYENYTEVFNEKTAQNFFEKFCSENYAVTPFRQKLISKEINCKLAMHPEPLLTTSYGIFLGLHSPFVEALDIFFLRLYAESGIKNRHQNVYDSIHSVKDLLILAFGIKRNYSTNKYENKYDGIYYYWKGPEDDIFVPVELAQVMHVLSIPFTGIIIGIIINIGEFVLSKVEAELQRRFLLRLLGLKLCLISLLNNTV